MIPEAQLGVVILTNPNGSTLSVALSSRIFDAYLGAPVRDWAAEILKDMNVLDEKARAAADEKGRVGEMTVGNLDEFLRVVETPGETRR